MPFLIVALVITAAIGGGIVQQAQQALPGDLLYPVKINVDEHIESMLASTDVSKTRFQITEVETRLQEAQALAKENKLTAAAQSQLTDNLDGHAQEVSTLLSKLESENDYQDATTLAVAFQTMLGTQVQLLQNASSEGSVARQVSLVPLLVEARKTLASASATSVDASAKAVAANITGT